MKKTLQLFLTTLFCSSFTAFAADLRPLVLQGHVTGTETGKVYLQKFENKTFITIDSATLEAGKFSFKTKLELPELYGVTLEKDQSPYYVFLESGEVNLELDPAANYRGSKVTGSAAQDLFIAYKKQKNVNISDFIKTNPKSIVSAYVLYREYSYRLSPQEIQANVLLLDPALHQSPYVAVLNELVTVLERVSIGKTAPDFSSVSPDGKTVSLKDFRGKYVLVDFWAAWCGPCRQENPNLVKAYQQYHDQGFEILGVSLDKKKEAWEKAIKDDHLTWTQVSDLAFWNSAPARLYGVRAIPSNVLLDPQGVIVGRNLRGEELQQKLQELFKP